MRALRALAVTVVVAFNGASALAASPNANVHIQVPFMMTVRVIDDQKGIYQVEVDNTNPLKYVNSYVWTAPGGLVIKKIIAAYGGTCTLEASANSVTCIGDAAPSSDIGDVGGGITVTFSATGNRPIFVATSYGGYYIHSGVIGSVQVREGGFSDLPLCKKGQQSTKSAPCTET